MNVRRIEVSPHARKPAGSYALIKLIGINELERPVRFRLQPASGARPGADWPTGPQKPVNLRTGANSVELLIGPEIVASAALKPGTDVRFQIPAANIDMTIKWPDLSAGSSDAPVAAPDGEGTASTDNPAAYSAAVHTSAAVELLAQKLADELTDRPNVSGAQSQPGTAASTIDHTGLIDTALINTGPVETGPVETGAVQTGAVHGGEVKGLARLQRRKNPAPKPLPVIPPIAVGTTESVAAEASAAATQSAAGAVVKVTKQKLPSIASGNAGIDPKAVSAYTGFRARAEAARAAQEQAARGRMSYAPVLIGLIVVVAMYGLFLRTTRIDGSGMTLLAAVSSRFETSPIGQASLRRALLSRIFESGAASPRGVEAGNVRNTEALERASELLAAAQTPADRAEAAFWLRKALSRNLSEPRLVWAVTQLGSAYAATEMGNTPDYEVARLLWGWAADAGDAQAACFLGRMHEQGLGTKPDQSLARTLYERARRLGGCPGLEQAMLRVGK